jgi:hypothetical protein
VSTTTTPIPAPEQIDRVRDELTEAAEVAKAGVAQAMGLAAGQIEGGSPTLEQIGSLALLAQDLDEHAKSLSYASIRLRQALVVLDERRKLDKAAEDDG